MGYVENSLKSDQQDEFEARSETNGMCTPKRRALVVVAHPDDETLWAGGTILMHPKWDWRVVSLCRGDDPDRRPKFFKAMAHLGAQGAMGDLDDGPRQHLLSDRRVQRSVRFAIKNAAYDLVISHSPFGEYTKHLRHEEVGRAVIQLWLTGVLNPKELWLFAYSDDDKTHYPTAIEDADRVISLPEDIWDKKLSIIKELYNFAPDSWEAMSTPRKEAFWCFDTPDGVRAWQRRTSKSSGSHTGKPVEGKEGEAR